MSDKTELKVGDKVIINIVYPTSEAEQYQGKRAMVMVVSNTLKEDLFLPFEPIYRLDIDNQRGYWFRNGLIYIPEESKGDIKMKDEMIEVFLGKQNATDMYIKSNGDCWGKISTAQLHAHGYYKPDEMEIDIDTMSKLFSKIRNVRSFDESRLLSIIFKVNPIKPKIDKESEWKGVINEYL